MSLDPDKIRKLARTTLETRPEGIGCGDWIHLVGEYVEARTRGRALDERLLVVERHARICRSCAQELEALAKLVAEEDAGEK
jgi:hypothetical protein